MSGRGTFRPGGLPVRGSGQSTDIKRYYGYRDKAYGTTVDGHDIHIVFDKGLIILNRVRLIADGEEVDREKVFYEKRRSLVSGGPRESELCASHIWCQPPESGPSSRLCERWPVPQRTPVPQYKGPEVPVTLTFHCRARTRCSRSAGS